MSADGASEGQAAAGQGEAKKPAPGGFRLEQLLPVACAAAAITLFASEFLTIFEFTPPSGEPLSDQSAADRHAFSQALLALFAAVALVAAVAAGSRPAARAVAVAGVLSLLIFLLLDLPDAGQIGTLDDPRQNFFEAEAIPQPGFWLELVGAIGLALTGAAMATLSSEQLAALRPRLGRRRPRRDDGRRGRGPAKGRDLIERAEGYGEEVKSRSETASKTEAE